MSVAGLTYVLCTELIECCFFSAFSSDLDDLSVKQLKEILMLNRVDFKGCCEKTELLERVKRLWNELHSGPGTLRLKIVRFDVDAELRIFFSFSSH